MRILLVSKFLHHVGGVETYLRWQARALHDAGHEVGLLGMRPPASAEIMDFPDVPVWYTPERDFKAGRAEKARSAAASVWSPATGRVMRTAVTEFDPEVVHFHGTCYQLTPSVVNVAAQRGIKSVITAHEYKLVCANQTLFNDSTREMCTRCVGQPGHRKSIAVIEQACMKGSRAVSALGAVEGRVADVTWRRARPHVLAPSTFMKDLLAQDGWDTQRLEYLDLPWRSDDERVGRPDPAAARNFVFLGRLAPNKGVDVLLRAWSRVAPQLGQARLRILGDGEESAALREQTHRDGIPRVDFLGYGDRSDVSRELSRAAATVHPSRWHENSPFSVRESLMAGVPAIVSAVGGMPEMVGPSSGYVVPHNDPDRLAEAILRASVERLAGSDQLRSAVQDRAMPRSHHLSRLLSVYSS